MNFGVGFQSSPSITDIDHDGDLEILIGTDINFSVIDIKESSNTEEFYWNTYRGDIHKTGSYTTDSLVLGDVNFDSFLNVQDLVIIINIIVGFCNWLIKCLRLYDVEAIGRAYRNPTA